LAPSFQCHGHCASTYPLNSIWIKNWLLAPRVACRHLNKCLTVRKTVESHISNVRCYVSAFIAYSSFLILTSFISLLLFVFFSLAVGFVSVFSPTRERSTLQKCSPWRSAQISAGSPVRSKHLTVSLRTRKCDDTDVHNWRTALLPNSCVHRTASCADTSHRISQNSDTKCVKIQTQFYWRPSIRSDFHCAHCD
jgi:hypothetical protein